jgi:transcriptional regulator with XRE-family HTH domain
MTSNFDPEKVNKFLAWLNIQLDAKGWSDYQLAKKAGIAHSVLSKARSGVRPIGWDACVSIAEALDLPPELVLQEAGHLPERKNAGPTLEEANFKLSKLPEWQQKMVLRMIDSILVGNKDEDSEHNVASSNSQTTAEG